MSDTFRACTLPWTIWPWGISLTHSDTDVLPECSVEFGALVEPTLPRREFWVKVTFELAAFASAKPHRDDESLADVTGYDIVPQRRAFSEEVWRSEEAEWLRTGVCPDPGVYFSNDSKWLDAERHSWAQRQRTSRSSNAAVHFLLNGRDGYVEILASGFSWQAWHQGRPLLSDVSGAPVMRGKWTRGAPD